MKCLVATAFTLSLLFSSSFVVPAQSQEASNGSVSLGPTTSSGSETCVEVEIGGEKAPGLNCLNQELKRKVDRVQPPPIGAPLDAQSPSVRVGTFNETAVSQQYGTNFGKSVVPQRPPTPIYASPIH